MFCPFEMKLILFFLIYLEKVNDVKTVSIRNFNKHLLEDKRVSISMVGDGNFCLCFDKFCKTLLN